MIYVALYKPETEGNVGAVARAMKNFGFVDLILVDPQCNPLSEDSVIRSKHASDVLKKAKQYKDLDFISRFKLVIGTTAIVGTDYNIPRSPIEISRFLDEFSKISGQEMKDFIRDRKNKILLLFGPEGTGLTSDELKKCDYLITIPTSEKYRALNLSHAVSIVLYEFSKYLSRTETSSIRSEDNVVAVKKGNSSRQGIVEIAQRSEKERLFTYSENAIMKLYENDSKKYVVSDSIKKMIFKSLLTKREVFALMGFFKNVEKNVPKNKHSEKKIEKKARN